MDFDNYDYEPHMDDEVLNDEFNLPNQLQQLKVVLFEKLDKLGCSEEKIEDLKQTINYYI